MFTQHEVTGINPADKTFAVTNLETGERSTRAYDALVLSTGAASIIPPIPGIVEKDGIAKYAACSWLLSYCVRPVTL